jgi:hypothetical protein
MTARRRPRRLPAAALLAALLITTPPAAAQTAGDTAPLATAAPIKGKGGWHASLILESRFVPIGVALRSDVTWRVPLWRESDHLLLNGTYIEAGFTGQLSPGSAHPGLMLKVVPLVPLELRVQGQQLRYFGNFGSLAEYEGEDANWSPDERRRAWDEKLGRHETGYKLSFEAVLKAKAGPVVLLVEGKHMWLGAPDVARGNAWYESSSDLLVAREDIVQTLNANLLYLWYGDPSGAEFLMTGARYEGWRTFETAEQRQFVTAAALWRPGWTTLRDEHLTFAALAGVYVDDPYRVGDPYIGLLASITLAGEGSR